MAALNHDEPRTRSRRVAVARETFWSQLHVTPSKIRALVDLESVGSGEARIESSGCGPTQGSNEITRLQAVVTVRCRKDFGCVDRYVQQG
jgi:hypothetical protein